MEVNDGKLETELIPPKWGGDIKFMSVNNKLNLVKKVIDIRWMTDLPPHSHKSYGIFHKAFSDQLSSQQSKIFK